MKILYIRKSEMSSGYLVMDSFEKAELAGALDMRSYTAYVPKDAMLPLYDKTKKYEDSLLMVVELLKTDATLSDRAKAILGTAVNSIEGNSINYLKG